MPAPEFPEENLKRAWCAGFGAVVLTALSLGLIGALVFRALPGAPPAPSLTRTFLFELSAVRPEPAERTVYLLSLLLGPAFLCGFYEVLKAGVSRDRRKAGNAVFLASAAALAAALIFFSSGDRFFYVGRTFLVQPVLAVIAVAAVYIGTRRADRGILLDRVFGAAAMALLVYGFAMRLFGRLDPYVFDVHFQSVFSSVVQVQAGRAPLSDYAAQYGLYALMLAPFFRLSGLSVLRFTAVMSALVLLAYALFLLLLLKTLRRPWIAFLALIAAIFFMDFDLPNLLRAHHVLDYYDPYFQYKPLRLLFPALAASFAAWDWEHPSPARRLLFTAALAAGCFWNLDSGAPSLAAWLGLLSFESLAARAGGDFRALARAWAAAFAGLAGAWLALSVEALAISGRSPDWSRFWTLARQFYVTGFFMLPMPLIHSWNIVVLLYAAGLLAAWISARGRAWNLRARACLLLSALGLMLFSYYQGRSHDWNLIVVSMPAFCLLGLFADWLLDLAREGRGGFPAARVAASALLAVLAAFAIRGAGEFGFFNRSIRERLVERREAYPGFSEDLAFLRDRVAPGETAEFFSYAEPVYYLATGARALSGPGLAELFRVDDLDRLFDAILDSPGTKLFADRTVLDMKTPDTPRRLNAAVAGFLKGYFKRAAVSPSGRIVVYERLSPG